MVADQQTDVVVVGGGPVGLAMGLELRARGVDFVLAEKGDLAVPHPRVGSVGPRSMELFRRWGVADRVRGAGWPADHSLDSVWVTRVGGHELYRLDRATMATRRPFAHTPEPDAICPQHWLTPVLADELGVAPDGPIRTRCAVAGVVESPDGVTVTVVDRDTGRQGTIAARFLVACDGTSSPIRKDCGIPAPTRYRTQVFRNILFRAPRLREQLGSRHALFYYLMLSSSLRFPLRALDGTSLYRLTVGIGGSPEAEGPPRALVSRALAVDTPFEVLSDDRWHLVQRVADEFRSGRVFLVGDAAHTLSPSGGFGMNTGICGAADLGWKLAAELSGWAGPGLLDTYRTERRPVAVAGLEEANRNLQRTMKREVPPEIHLSTAGGERARAAMAERLERSGVGREFDAPMIHLGFRYSSPIIVPDEGEDEDHVVERPNSLPGSRAPHAWLAPGVSTLDLFGDGFRLLCFAASDRRVAFERAFARRGVPLAATDCTLPEVAALYERAFVLVRPDGHVAWRADELPSDATGLADRVRGAGRLCGAA
ncbi:FAD-dependent monooxygenase [Pseudonocardia xinjiangensis]|uniref:FAD-dependent monooxygenase n=1 Tax=Pseudonocardia xinjiangensis TaxID=75289 RepID=UPI003D8D9A35